MTLLWTEKERKEVCMLMPGMLMMNLKMVSITEELLLIEILDSNICLAILRWSLKLYRFVCPNK